MSCGWTLCRRSRTSSSTRKMLEPGEVLLFSLLFRDLIPRAVNERTPLPFLGSCSGDETVDDEVAAAAAAGLLAGGEGLAGGESNGSGGGSF